MTLEDETGIANVVILAEGDGEVPQEEQGTADLVEGRIQSSREKVVHLVAEAAGVEMLNT